MHYYVLGSYLWEVIQRQGRPDGAPKGRRKGKEIADPADLS
jgi:hypothetical protein